MPTPTIQLLQPSSVVAGDGAAVIQITGPRNAQPARLANDALHLSLPPEPSITPTAASLTGGPLVLTHALEPDAPIPVTALPTTLAGVSVLAVRLPDLDRPTASPIHAFFAPLQRAFFLRADAVAPPLPNRRLLVLAVRDYEPAVVSEQDVRRALQAQLDDAFASIDLPDRFAASSLYDFYDTDFVFLPSAKHCPDDYARAVNDLGDSLRDANKSYADAGMTSQSLNDAAEKIQSALGDDSAADLPAERELAATFACNAVMQSVLEKHRNNAKQWKATVDAGRVIRNFGTENDRLVKKTLQVYDEDAAVYKSTRAFPRKREQLQSVLLSDAYALFAKQILKVRENAYQVFRAKLARIRINDQVEKNVRGAVKEAELFFVDHAESLRSTLGNWRFDNERHELVNHMRDDATERLQLARLQGNYVPPMRSPIAFAFHTLLLAPFGKDSRFAHPHAEDMKQSYDPDKVKQAGLMRARPHQRNAIFSVKAKDEVGSTVVERFAALLDDDDGSS